MKLLSTFILPLSFLAAACDLEVTGNTDFELESGKDYLLVTTSDFESGGLSALDIAAGKIYNDLLFPHSDTNVVATGGAVYIVNRFGSDSVTSVTDNFNIIFDESTGAGTNPHDLVLLDDGRAVVSLYGSDELAVLTAGTGELSEKIDVAGFADGDGIPELSALVREGDFIYGAVQNLNRSAASWPTTGDGRLVQIAIADLAVTELATMPFANPFSDFQTYTNTGGDTLLVISCPGDFGGPGDGGLVYYDISAGSYTTLLTETSAGGYDLMGGLLVTDDEGVVILSDKNSFESALARFDVTSGEVTEVLVGFGANKVKDIAILDNRLFVAQASATNPGIRIFNTENWNEVTGAPISTGLPPYSIEVLEK